MHWRWGTQHCLVAPWGLPDVPPPNAKRVCGRALGVGGRYIWSTRPPLCSVELGGSGRNQTETFPDRHVIVIVMSHRSFGVKYGGFRARPPGVCVCVCVCVCVWNPPPAHKQSTGGV